MCALASITIKHKHSLTVALNLRQYFNKHTYHLHQVTNEKEYNKPIVLLYIKSQLLSPLLIN